MTKRKFRFLIVIFLVVVFLALVFLFSKKKSPEKSDEKIPVVQIQKPQRKNLVESILISGYVEARDMIPVVPFVSGTILEYPVHAGEFVEKNTLLAKIDDEPYKQQLRQAEAAYSSAKSTYNRVASLYRAEAATQQNYENAKSQYEAYKAQYDLAKLQVDYTEVRAPVDGTVLVADMAVGSIGNQSQPVAVLADLSSQVVRLKVPEKYFDLFILEKENLTINVIRPAEKNMFEDAQTTATIQNIAPYISPQSKNFEVVCSLDNPGERFRPGMYVKVQVGYKTHSNVPVVPITAKKIDGSVYLYDADSKTVHFVVPEKIADDGKDFIVEEKYGESFFVVDGQNFLFDGQKVKLYEDALKEVGYEK